MVTVQRTASKASLLEQLGIEARNGDIESSSALEQAARSAQMKEGHRLKFLRFFMPPEIKTQ
eukprot:5940174-Prymnesium_polylepis.2